MSFWEGKKVLVTGGAGFLGSYVVNRLGERGVTDIVVPRSRTCDLRIRGNCREVVQGKDMVIHLAAKAGGIGLNKKKPGEVFYENLIMGLQLMEESRLAGVGKFVAVGSVCAYPKYTPLPFKEENLWTGYPEETNASYGLAKKMLLVQSQAYRQQYGFNSIFLLLANLYGPGDNFDPETSHVIPALVKKCIDALKQGRDEIEVWGTGKVSREFLYVEDAAEAVLLAAERFNKPDPVNIGSAIEVTIENLVKLIAEMTGFRGRIIWDTSKPDGQPRRSLNVSRAQREFGFSSKTDLREGLKKTIEYYIRK